MPAPSDRQTLIIGFGNPLRGDDGVAWHILDGLDQDDLPAVQCLATHQLTPELAELVSAAEKVIFVDAAEGVPVGAVAHFSLRPEPNQAGFTFHELTPPGLLALAAQLYGPPPPATMLIVNGLSFDTSEHLSDPVAAAVPEAIQRLRSLVSVLS